MPTPPPRRSRPPLLARVARSLHQVWLQHRDDGVAAFCRAYAREVLLSLRLRRNRSYWRWTQLYDSPTPEDLARLGARCAALDWPVIALVMPVHETDERWLRPALDSVLAQTWPHWQLCIADDASTRPQVRRVLEQYRARDARIRVVYRDTGGHISAASNSALALVDASHVGFLDHDDLLSPHALQLVAEELRAHPRAKLVYTDEDVIDTRGRRLVAHFKPDFSPELLLSYNYVTHLAVYPTALVRELGGLREGLEGAQDHDLALRVFALATAAEVRHVPHVCYHWRQIPGSTSGGGDAKPYAAEAGRRAVAEHIAAASPAADVESVQQTHFHVRFPPPAEPPLVSVVIPTRDHVELLRMAVAGLLSRTDYPRIEVVVVDNQSTDPDTLAYLEAIDEDARVCVVRHDAPFNYPEVNAAGVARASGEALLLLNNDIEVLEPGWLTEMVGLLQRPGVGAVGARLLYPDRSVQHAGVVLIPEGIAAHVFKHCAGDWAGYMRRAVAVQNLSAVTGACLLVRRDVYDAVGGLDPALRVAFNDIDLCLKIVDAGWRIVYTPHAELVHHESKSRGTDTTPERWPEFVREQALMRERWGPRLAADPYLSPNLVLTDTGYDFAFPPRTSRPWDEPEAGADRD